MLGEEKVEGPYESDGQPLKILVVNFVSFRPEWPEFLVLVYKPEWETPSFHLKFSAQISVQFGGPFWQNTDWNATIYI